MVDATAPTTPIGVAAAVEIHSVGLSWVASTDSVGVRWYQVHGSATGGFTPSKASKIADVTSGTAYSDRARPAGTWYYRVIAVDAAGNASPPSRQVTAVVADTTAPASPTTPAAVVVTDQDVALSWAASTDDVAVTGYEVYRSATAGFTPNPLTRIADVTSGTAYTDGARPAGTWYYRVVAVDAAGNASTVSNPAPAVVAGTGATVSSAPAGTTGSSSPLPPTTATRTG